MLGRAGCPDRIRAGAQTGRHRPGDTFNASRIATTVVVPLTGNLRLAAAPGSVVLAATRTGLPKDSVADVSQLLSVDRALLTERVGHLAATDLQLVLAGIDLVLGRESAASSQRPRQLPARVSERRR